VRILELRDHRTSPDEVGPVTKTVEITYQERRRRYEKTKNGFRCGHGGGV
jgi:hypothetical protein